LKFFVNESITKALGNLNASPLQNLLKNMQQHIKKHEEKLHTFDEKMNKFTDDAFFDKLENDKKIQEENNIKQQDIFKG
jgi:predicted  nucleic acid-binding Zn-ribbon protein